MTEVITEIFEKIKNIQELKEIGCNVFLSIPENTKFPYIYITNVRTTNRKISNAILQKFSIDIHLYSKSRKVNEINKINAILNAMLVKNFGNIGESDKLFKIDKGRIFEVQKHIVFWRRFNIGMS